QRGGAGPLDPAEHRRPGEPGPMGPVHDLGVQRPVVPDVVLPDEDRQAQGATGRCPHGCLHVTIRRVTPAALHTAARATSGVSASQASPTAARPAAATSW